MLTLKQTYENKLGVSLNVFMEDKAFIVYCPGIDLSGYGNTKKQALESFEIVYNEFLKYRAGVAKK